MSIHNLELLVQFLALASIVAPLLIQKYSKGNRLKSNQHFLTLLKHKAELSEMIQAQETHNEEAHILYKLKWMHNEVVKEINAECNDPQRTFHPYFFIIAVEIIIGYNFLFLRLMNRIAKRAMEGAMTWTSVKLLLWGLIFSISTLLTLWISKFIRVRLKSYVVYNVSVVIVFNILVLTFVGLIGFTLKYLDPSVSWF